MDQEVRIALYDESRGPEVASLWNDVASEPNVCGDHPDDDEPDEPVTEASLTELVRSERYVADATLVAEVDGRCVGFAAGIVDPDPGAAIDDYCHAQAQVEALAVHPEYRRRGIGRRLIEQVESVMRDLSSWP